MVSVIFLDKPNRIEKNMSVFIVLSLTVFNMLVFFFGIPIPAKSHPFSTANSDKVLIVIKVEHHLPPGWDLQQLGFPAAPRENQSLCVTVC